MAKIMVVDDEPDMVWAITNVLLTQNHSVVSVNSGEDALKTVQETLVDLVLLDFRLPGMDGVQILEKIKQIRPDLPVIMVTGYGGIEEAVQSIKLGAAHYISKPFDNDHLLEVTNKALQLNLLRKEGVFGKRIAEKIDPKPEDKPAGIRPASWKEPRPRWKAWVLTTLAGVALAAGAAWLYVEEGSRDYSILHSKTSGLSFGMGQLWACDWFTQSIYKYEVKGRKLELAANYTLPGYHFTGIAWAGEFLYTCDSWKKEIYKHSIGGNLPIIETYKSPGANPSGLFFDGKYLWSCDGHSRKVYQHALDGQLTVLNSYDTLSRFPVGIYKEGGTLFYAGVGGMIYRHSLNDGFKHEKTYGVSGAGASQQMSAFTLEDGRAWFSQEGLMKIFARDLDELPEVRN